MVGQKYIIYRVPIEADKGFKQKKALMEKNIKNWTGKDIRIPMTRVMTLLATNPAEIHEKQIIRVVRKKKQ